jgi:hypothetical protein
MAVSAAVAGTAVSNYDAVVKVISGCYGPSLLAPVLHIGSQAMSISSWFDPIFFSTNTTFNISCTASGMDTSALGISANWYTFSPFDGSVYGTGTTLLSCISGSITGSFWKGNTGVIGNGFGGPPKYLVSACTVDDLGRSPAILSVTTPNLTSASTFS